MLVLLSPAKALELSADYPQLPVSQPRFLAETEQLVEIMKTKSVAQLSKLMSISDELAALNADRYADFELPFDQANARPAIATFNGDVYQGMKAGQRFDTADYERAQGVVRILSGLYGVLRPLDLMQAYRLEMGTKLETPAGKNLYQFWGEKITELLNQDLAESPGEKLVVNLASQEYFSAVAAEKLAGPVIAPRFEDYSAKGRRSVISFYAKRARGEMAAWIVTNKITKAEQLVDFDQAGYRYHETDSTFEQPVFVRAFEDR